MDSVTITNETDGVYDREVEINGERCEVTFSEPGPVTKLMICSHSPAFYRNDEGDIRNDIGKYLTTEMTPEERKENAEFFSYIIEKTSDINTCWVPWHSVDTKLVAYLLECTALVLGGEAPPYFDEFDHHPTPDDDGRTEGSVAGKTIGNVEVREDGTVDPEVLRR